MKRSGVDFAARTSYNASMSMIHVSRSGDTLGVFEEEKVREGLRSGEFIGTDLGWTEGMPNWRPLSELDEFRKAEATTPVTPAASTAAATSPIASTPVAMVPVKRTEPLAIWSLVLSCIGLVCCGCFVGIGGVVCGHLALGRINKDPNLEGRGMAMAGLIIGYCAIAFWILYFVFFGGMAMLQSLSEGTHHQ